MRIPCPCCGPRDHGEFTYLGDAGPARPAGLDADPAAMLDYVYLRDNPAGPHDELWYHNAGCHAWLVVRRDLRSHAVMEARLARDVAAARDAEAA